jgi:alpha-tubulin suppressor-like RCC1 family protein
VAPLLGLHIVQVSCGGQHGAVLTASGQVWTWGRGGFGRLGHGDNEHQSVPKLVEALANMRCVQVACGFAYTAVVSAEGELFTFGSGDNGRLGHGDRTDRRSPCRVDGLRGVFVKRVCAGSVHTCVLDDMGRVYSFGKHEYSGHGLSQDVLSPLELKGFADSGKVVDLSVGPGGYHTMVLTESGDIYTWGHNRVGQLGCSHDACDHFRNFEGAFYLPIPVRVANSREWEAVRVVAGWGHSAIITRQGQVLMCGRNLHGQLGLGDPGKFPTNERGHPYQPEFMTVQKLLHERVVEASCGGEHSMFLCANGDIYSAGTGSRGQLGHGDTDPVYEPKLIAAFRKERAVIKQVSCGNNSTLLLVGRKRVPTLHEIAIDVVRHSEEAMKLLDSEENYLLPEEIVDYIRRTSSVQPFSSVHP